LEHGPFRGDQGIFFAEVTGAGCAGPIVVNDDTGASGFDRRRATRPMWTHDRLIGKATRETVRTKLNRHCRH
jgi:hypothetical protein